MRQDEPGVDTHVWRTRYGELEDEVVAAVDAGEPVRADDAQQAAGELRELYRGLLDRPEAEGGAGRAA